MLPKIYFGLPEVDKTTDVQGAKWIVHGSLGPDAATTALRLYGYLDRYTAVKMDGKVYSPLVWYCPIGRVVTDVNEPESEPDLNSGDTYYMLRSAFYALPVYHGVREVTHQYNWPNADNGYIYERPVEILIAPGSLYVTRGTVIMQAVNRYPFKDVAVVEEDEQ